MAASILSDLEDQAIQEDHVHLSFLEDQACQEDHVHLSFLEDQAIQAQPFVLENRFPVS
jgi:hypothetical protein